MFEENEIQTVHERAEAEWWKEKMDKIELHPEFRLTQLQERIDKTTQDLDTRISSFKDFVISHPLDDSGEIVEVPTSFSPQEELLKKQEEYTSNFRQELKKSWRFWIWGLKVIAFDYIQNMRKVEDNPDATWQERAKWWLAWVLWSIGMGIIGWDLYKKFKAGFDWLKLWNNDKKFVEKPEADLDKVDEHKNTKFKFTSSIFINFFKNSNELRVANLLWEDTGDIEKITNMYQSIVHNQSFTELTFQELLEIKENWYNESNEIVASLHEKTGYPIQSILATIRLLTEWRAYTVIEDVFSKKDSLKDTYMWLKIDELFLAMNDEIALLNDLWSFDILSSIDLRNPSNIDPETESMLQEKGLSVPILASAFLNEWYIFSINPYEQILWSIKNPNTEEQKRVENISNFWMIIQESMFGENSIFEIYKVSDNENDWDSIFDKLNELTFEKRISEIFSGNNALNLWEVVKLRILTWGETEFWLLNIGQQTALYLTIAEFIQEREWMDAAWQYLTALWERSLIKGDDKIPEGVKAFIWDSLKTMWIAAAEAWKEILAWIIGMWKQNLAAGAWFAALTLLAPWFAQRKSLAWMTRDHFSR